MKSSILSTITMLSLSAVLGPVQVKAQAPINVKVPFDFNVGSKSFAAGEYTVQQAATSVLSVRSADGHSTTLIGTIPSEPNSRSGTAKLTFNRYGDHYFLFRVSDNSRGWTLSKSAAEGELIAKRASSTGVTFAAAIN